MKNAIIGWVKSVVGGTVSSKKTLASAGAVTMLMAVNQKYALIAFAIWMVCQTAVDVAKVLKDKK